MVTCCGPKANRAGSDQLNIAVPNFLLNDLPFQRDYVSPSPFQPSTLRDQIVHFENSLLDYPLQIVM